MSEKKQGNKRTCSKCIWSIWYGSSVGCGFILKTGKRRGCPAKNCIKFISKNTGLKIPNASESGFFVDVKLYEKHMVCADKN